MSAATTALNTQSTAASLGGLVHRSAVATSPHDPYLSLASHNVRSCFGDSVQLVVDALQTKGALSYRQLMQFLVKKPTNLSSTALRASLLVLLQHSIVKIQESIAGKVLYEYVPQNAVYLLRYSRYIECTKKGICPLAATVVETLLLAGRLRTVDLLRQATLVATNSAVTTNTTSADDEDVKQPPTTTQTSNLPEVLEALYKLVRGGFITKVRPAFELEDEEMEFDEEPPKKRVRIQDEEDNKSEDPEIQTLLQTTKLQYAATLPLDCVWKVNVRYYHDRLRATALGKLVHECYGQKITAAGSIVQAALLHRAHLKHVGGNPQETNFSSTDLVKYIPATALAVLEKKGDLQKQLAHALVELTAVQSPPVFRQLDDNCYQVQVPELLHLLHDRLAHKVVRDRHGETAARIVTILREEGWLESDKIAQLAMVPTKDTRETLHALYRSHFVELFPINRFHHAQYVWLVNREVLLRAVSRNVAHALWNIRLRLQRQMQVGKEWIDRAQEQNEENVHEEDRLQYQRFCVGLERLDHAALQLDETLMVLRDYGDSY